MKSGSFAFARNDKHDIRKFWKSWLYFWDLHRFCFYPVILRSFAMNLDCECFSLNSTRVLLHSHFVLYFNSDLSLMLNPGCCLSFLHWYLIMNSHNLFASKSSILLEFKEFGVISNLAELWYFFFIFRVRLLH